MSPPRTLTVHPKPDVPGGLAYWQSVEANVNGVLGGYGEGVVPRVDSLGSRRFLLSLLPRLSSIPDVTLDPLGWKQEMKRRKERRRRTRGLDAGAGVGRVTRDVLGLLLDEVHLVEPVRKFLVAAAKEAPTWPSLQSPSSSTSTSDSDSDPSSILSGPKSVHFHISTLHAIHPARPWSTSDGGIFLKKDRDGLTSSGSSSWTSSGGSGGRNKRAKVGMKDGELEMDLNNKRQQERTMRMREEQLIPPVIASSPKDDRLKQEDSSSTSTIASVVSPSSSSSSEQEPLQYDVIWCQWMLQHLSDADLISFLHRARDSLVRFDHGKKDSNNKIPGDENEDEDGVIVVKENVCSELEDGSENVWWDEEDKSITRSTKAYERVFREAGLNIVRCQVQEGLPEELFVVKMWALR